MATADQLLDLIDSWMEENERCERQLRKLADELESLKKRLLVSQCVGSSVTVLGVACTIVGGVLTTVATGGAAAPFLGALGAASTGVGGALSLSAEVIEIILSSGPMTEAKKAAEKSAEIEKKIQQHYEKLKLEQRRKNPSADLDTLDQNVVWEIVRAIAKRSGKGLHVDLPSSAIKYIYNDKNLQTICAATLGIFTLFAFKLGGARLMNLYQEGMNLGRVVSSTAGKKIAAAVGLVSKLREAIGNCKDMIENNNETEASRSMRAIADEIAEVNRGLKKQFDDIRKMLHQLPRRRHGWLPRGFGALFSFLFGVLILYFAVILEAFNGVEIETGNERQRERGA